MNTATDYPPGSYDPFWKPPLDVAEVMNMDATTQTKIPEPIDEAERLRLKKLPVMEIFGPTVQGEGLVIGQRTLFIRFGLCDYKCKMCDSMHAVDPDQVSANAKWLIQEEIAKKVLDLAAATNTGWVTISGGNPAIHDLTVLASILKEYSIGISVETQGTFAPPWLAICDYITVSPKGPGMGEKFEMGKFVNFYKRFQAHPGLSIKVVAFHAIDLEFASMIAELCPREVNTDRFYISLGNPHPPKIEADGLAPDSVTGAWYLLRDQSIERYKAMLDEIKHYPALRTARFLPQLHTWLWGNEKGR
jgi:7-carboxy-7-deazaguanine synthase